MAEGVVRERCVLLLGKTEAGKSAVANHLVGHDPLSPAPDEPPFAAESVTSEIVEFTWENDSYRVTVVDTPGLYLPNGEKLIFDKVVQYIRENKLRIDLILFVVKEGPIEEEKAMFSFIMAKFREKHSALAIAGCPQDISSISALVVMVCDTTAREEFVQKYKVDRRTGELASQMGMGIYPVGFPPVECYPDPVLKTKAHRPQMDKDRDTLRGLIARAKAE